MSEKNDHACLTVFEFGDGQGPETRVVYRGTEQRCQNLAIRLERAGSLRYEGAREPLHAFVAVSPLSRITEPWCAECGLVGPVSPTGLCPGCQEGPGSPQEAV